MMKRYITTEALSICDKGVTAEPRFVLNSTDDCVGVIRIKKGEVFLEPDRFSLGKYLLDLGKLVEEKDDGNTAGIC